MTLYDFSSLAMDADVPVTVRLRSLTGKRSKVVFRGALCDAQLEVGLRTRKVFGWETMPNDPEGELIVYIERE